MGTNDGGRAKRPRTSQLSVRATPDTIALLNRVRDHIGTMYQLGAPLSQGATIALAVRELAKGLGVAPPATPKPTDEVPNV